MQNKECKETLEVTISALGGMGDGLAESNGTRYYVPFSCAGETVRILPTQPKAKLLEVLQPADDRQTAPCVHFGQCGGCQLQHLNPSAYAEFKQQLLQQILKRLGVEESVLQPLITVGQHSRRRAEFKLSKGQSGVDLGFYAAASHQVIPLRECLVVESPIFEAAIMAKAPIEAMKKPGILSAIHITQLSYGLDVILHLKKPLTEAERELWVQHARKQGWVRLTQQQAESRTTLYDYGQAVMQFGEVEVALPAGAFLQASRAGEQAILSQLRQHLTGCIRLLDLYAGAGTYSFPMAQQCQHVTALEGEDSLIAAMHNAIVKQGLETRIEARIQDLFRQPVPAEQISSYDGIIINPPRNGALPQVKNIAKSTVKKLVMVSCNPATFQRDAQTLLEGGYTLRGAVAIDQFTYSAHLEVVAYFERG